MTSSGRLIGSMLVIVVLAIAFWVMLLSPKREEAKKVDAQVQSLRSSLAQAQSDVATATEARKHFPDDYKQVVLLGKAVPSGDDTSSLLVELSKIAQTSKVSFDGISLADSAASASTSVTPNVPVAPPTTAPTTTTDPGAVPASTSVPPTEAAAALLPIGASVGPAGLGVLPYNLTFTGDFFHVADFIQGIDQLVKTDPSRVAVDGRLVTIDGFSLSGDANLGFPHLHANFTVTAYLTPPDQGLTAGATPAAPATSPTLTTTPPVDSPAGGEAAATAATTGGAAK